MSNVDAQVVSSGIAGNWQVLARTPGGTYDVTSFRNTPTQIGSLEFADPFGPRSATITFPSITVFDRIGQGDLAWLNREISMEIVWVPDASQPTFTAAGYKVPYVNWEGYVESWDRSPSGLSVTLKGALYQLDNYLAKPLYSSRPLPYEIALQRQFQDKPDLRVAPLKVTFPSWWAETYTPISGAAAYTIPIGVASGDKWTALLTRSTGSWNQTLTGYMQSLLASMYTKRGRWTIMLTGPAQPSLIHNDYVYQLDVGHVLLDPASPGCDISIREDFSQSLNVVYGQGKSVSGSTYSGQLVQANGDVIYQPLAQLRQVVPEDENAWRDLNVMRREVLLEVQPGLEESQARSVATNHLEHFSDPGVTGTVTLSTDVKIITTTRARVQAGQNTESTEVATTTWISRFLLRPGMTFVVPGLLGKPEGTLLFITEVTLDVDGGSVSCTVDSKYRDALTVAEVRERGRDSLIVQRSLLAGEYNPPVNDQLIPWSYEEGSGFIPHSRDYTALPLFRNLTREQKDSVFPYTEITTARPPGSKAWSHCYIPIGPKSTNADQNWSQHATTQAGFWAFPVKMAQAGTVRLLEIAAYDRFGNVFPVPFHVSFYYSRGINVQAMPAIKAGDTNRGGYAVGQHYPYFTNAWEQYNLNGTLIASQGQLVKGDGGLIQAYGTGLVKAGYWPGAQRAGDTPTGMLVDEGGWEFNTFDNDKSLLPTTTNQTAANAGYIYVMIYCDAQGDQDVFFMGRLYRQEPGTGESG